MRRFLPALSLSLLSLPLAAQAAANPIGAGCPGSNGVPTLSAAQGPILGQPLTVDVSNMPVILGQVWWLWGVDDVNWSSNVLPLDMALYGMPGCNLYISPMYQTFQFQTAPTLSETFFVPQQASLLGCRLLNQVLVCDSGINQAGYTSTNALELLFGI